MIEARDIDFTYDSGRGPVFRDLSLEIQTGEYIAIIGPNGCGKTTLVKHFNGLLRPSKGDVWVEGLNTKDPATLKEIRQKVGMLFQNPDNQIVGMSVEEDVAFGPENLGLSSCEIRNRVESSLETVGLSDFGKRPPHALSSGEKQLVAIAGVLAMDPTYIILDEPTGFLDPSSKMGVLSVIRQLNAGGITIIHVTHDMDEVVGADRIVVMDDGKIILIQRPVEVFARIDWLEGLGLEVPKVASLMARLRRMGTPVRPHVLTIEDACSEILSLMNKKAS